MSADDGDEPREKQKKISLAKLLERGANPDALSPCEDAGSKRTLLCIAVAEAVQVDEFSNVETLLDGKADVNKASETGVFPLQLAVKSAHLQLTRMLLQRKANVNQQDQKLVTPLHNAVYKDDPRVVQLLLLHKANVNAPERLGQPPLFFAASPEIIDVLLDNGADLLHLNNVGQCALHLTAHCGSYDAVAHLVEMEMMRELVNLKDQNGRTPLHHAAVRGHQAVVSRLMDVGADPKIQTNRGQTAMSLADAKHTDVAYYIYCRTTGGKWATWGEAFQNPILLCMAAILGAASFVNRRLLWELFWDLMDMMRS